jgi:hypothetical protein
MYFRRLSKVEVRVKGGRHTWTMTHFSLRVFFGAASARELVPMDTSDLLFSLDLSRPIQAFGSRMLTFRTLSGLWRIM